MTIETGPVRDPNWIHMNNHGKCVPFQERKKSRHFCIVIIWIYLDQAPIMPSTHAQYWRYVFCSIFEIVALGFCQQHHLHPEFMGKILTSCHVFNRPPRHTSPLVLAYFLKRSKPQAAGQSNFSTTSVASRHHWTPLMI